MRLFTLALAFEQDLTVTEARICAATGAHWEQEAGSNLSAAIVDRCPTAQATKSPPETSR